MTVENDANLGALAETQLGAARGREGVIYVQVASGIGAGIVLGGRVHRGATGIAGEIGHVQVRARRRPLPLREPRLPGDGRVDERDARRAAVDLRQLR